MWNRVARWILRFRLSLLIIMILLTLFMLYHAIQVKITYKFEQALPSYHPLYETQDKFRELFGHDGNVLFVGVQTDQLFTYPFFRDWFLLAERFKQLEGVEGVLSISHLPVLQKDTAQRRFVVRRLLPEPPEDDSLLYAVKQQVIDHPFGNLVYNPVTNATLIGISIDPKVLQSKKREKLIERIRELTNSLATTYDFKVYFSGLPFIRNVISTYVRKELILFLALSTFVVGFILLLLFRSVSMVLIPLAVAGISVIWTLGIIHLLGYKITLLTGLMPPILIVIVVPNCVYLITRYHTEWQKLGNPISAWNRALEKVGEASLYTYLTTAIGFGVFMLTGSGILAEFGLVALISIMSAYLITIVFVPPMVGVLKPPSKIQYLSSPWMVRLMDGIAHIVFNHTKRIILVFIALVVVAIYGTFKIKITGFLSEDLPAGTYIEDLRFFENNFGGILPVELLVRAKKGNILTDVNLRRLDKLQNSLDSLENLSKPLSIVDLVKYVVQTFYDGSPQHFRLPSSLEKSFIASYLKGSDMQNKLFLRFVDSTRQYARVSMRMPDIGIKQYEQLEASIINAIDRNIDTSKLSVQLTGTGVLFIHSNQYLTTSLIYSLLVAAITMFLLMLFLFRSVRISLIILFANIIPLVATAGMMGFLFIPLKPATVLIFSIALGIVVDSAIHLVTRFAQEIRHIKGGPYSAIQLALLETGRSIVYNGFVLLLGFLVFILSKFQGTQALGILVSVTLLVGTITNLILLPALLLFSIKKGNLQ